MRFQKFLLVFFIGAMSLCTMGYPKLFNDEFYEGENIAKAFSIAQTCRSLEYWEEAIYWYSKRLEFEDKDDEHWFSKFMVGECHERLGFWNNALHWYLEAYQENPAHPESILKITNYYIDRDKYELAVLFAKHGSQVPYSKHPLYPEFAEHNFDVVLTVSAFYSKLFKNTGMQASDQLIFSKDLPWYIRDQTYRNFLFYIDHLSEILIKSIDIDLPLINEDDDECYHPMNPSIMKTEDGYEMICRSVNYTQTGAKVFDTIAEDGIIRTKNFLLQYDKNFNLLSQQEILEELPRKREYCWGVEGLEDGRIFSLDDQFYFSCTTADTNPTGNRQISVCKLENVGAEDSIYVEELTPMLGLDLNRCEKNWLPFVKDNELYFIYSFDPFIVMKPDLASGECPIEESVNSSLNFSSFRGSASPIPFDNGYLTVVHEVVFNLDFSRCYLHRFVYFDEDFNILKISDPFTFMHQGIEFCCGMTTDHTEERVVLSFGIEDYNAYLGIINIKKVRSLLHPLPVIK